MKKLTLSILTIAALFQAPAFANTDCSERIIEQTENIANQSVNGLCITKTAHIDVDSNLYEGRIIYNCRTENESQAEASLSAKVYFIFGDKATCTLESIRAINSDL